MLYFNHLDQLLFQSILYIFPRQVTLACTAGSPLGAKLLAAMQSCMGEPQMEPTGRRGWGRPSGGRKCPTVEMIQGKILSHMEGEY
jgi:hypothetical protein